MNKEENIPKIKCVHRAQGHRENLTAMGPWEEDAMEGGDRGLDAHLCANGLPGALLNFHFHGKL